MNNIDNNNSEIQQESGNYLRIYELSNQMQNEVKEFNPSTSNFIIPQRDDDYNSIHEQEIDQQNEEDCEQMKEGPSNSEYEILTLLFKKNRKKQFNLSQYNDDIQFQGRELPIDTEKEQDYFDQKNEVNPGNFQSQIQNEAIPLIFQVNSCPLSSQKADDELQVEQEGNLQNQKQRELGCSSSQIKQNKETIINKKKETKKSKEKTKKKKKATKKSGKGIKKEKKETQKLKKAIKKKGTQQFEKGIKNEQKVSKKSKKIIKKKGTKKSGKKAIKKNETQKSEKGIQNEMKVDQNVENAIEMEQEVTTQSKKAIKNKYDNQTKNYPGFFKRYLYKLASSFGENWLHDNYPNIYEIDISETLTLDKINQLLSIEPLKQKFIESIENDDLLFYILQSEKLLSIQSYIEALSVYHQQLITTGIIKNQTISKKKRQKIQKN